MTSKLLSAAELAQMRTDLEAYALPDTCTILSVTQTPDNEGGMTESWGTATASVACRLDARGGGRADVATSLTPYSSWMLTLPQSATIVAGNRVVHGGYTYAVMAVGDDPSWPVCLRATLERVDA